MTIQPIPAKVNIWDKDGKYQSKNYIVVDFVKTSIDSEGNICLVGNDADGKRVAIEAKRKQITRYAGKMSEYWRNHFLKKNGLTQRALNRNWRVSKAQSIQVDKVTDNDRRALKQSKGIAFSDNELADINALSAFNDMLVTIVSVDPDIEKIKIKANDLELELAINVFRAFSFYELPPMPESANEYNETRKLRTLTPYDSQLPNRSSLTEKTPNLSAYFAEDSKRFKLGGNLYVNFGLQQYGESIGEQIFRNELALFGLNPDHFPFENEEILKINEARPNPSDSPLHAAWAGEVTIEADGNGTVPRAVMLDIFKLVGNSESDSKPHYKTASDWQRSTEEDFFEDYKKGPVFYNSNKLFRHLIGLGFFGNNWIGE